MSISHRIVLSFPVIASLIVGNAVLVQGLRKSIEEIESTDLAKERLLNEIEVNLWEAINAVDSYRLTGDMTYSDLFHKKKNNVDLYFNRYSEIALQPNEKEQFPILGNHGKQQPQKPLKLLL